MGIIDSEARRERELQRSEFLREGRRWPPAQEPGAVDWFRWVLYSVWLLHPLILGVEAAVSWIPVVFANKTLVSLLGGVIALSLGYGLLSLQSLYPKTYVLLTSVFAALLGSKAFYDLVVAQSGMSEALLSFAGAVYFSRDALVELHACREGNPDEKARHS